MQTQSQQKLFDVRLRLPSDKTKTVRIKASSNLVAMNRAEKRVDVPTQVISCKEVDA